jgi:hypothetical protein
MRLLGLDGDRFNVVDGGEQTGQQRAFYGVHSYASALLLVLLDRLLTKCATGSDKLIQTENDGSALRKDLARITAH